MKQRIFFFMIFQLLHNLCLLQDPYWLFCILDVPELYFAHLSEWKNILFFPLTTFCFILKMYLLLFYVYEGFAWMYVCTSPVYCAHRSQKRELDVLELELQVIVSHYADAGDWTWLPYKSSKCSCQVTSPAPFMWVFLVPSLHLDIGTAST